MRAGIPYRILIVLILVVGSVPPASAHSDDALEQQVTVAPGTSEAFELKIHWHRVVGTVTSESGPVGLRLVRDATGHDEWTAPPADRHGLNHLIRCCDGSTWSTYLLIIDNPGDAALQVTVDVRAMHDDFMVMVEQAESGIIPVGLFFGALGAGFAWHGHQNLGRTVDPQEGRRHWRRALALWLVLVIPPTLLALPGMFRLGVGPFTGLVAGLSSLPPAPGIFGAVAYLGFLVLILWFVILHQWTRSMGSWPGAHGRIVAGGLVLTIGTIAFTMALAVEHSAILIPGLYGIAFAGPVGFLTIDAARRSLDDATSPEPAATTSSL